MNKLDALQRDVCDAFNITEENISSRVKKREYADARKVFSHVANKTLGAHPNKIALYLRKDRTSVLVQVERCQELADTDPSFRDILNKILSKYDNNKT
jgi:chromosomal replication initiation ATPase DnaA